ncbi:HD-GYP domain-containing protein [Brevibacillus panacihumi]|nr:HD domain-containing phosphohydrolase [Brevibacillus panacihumi]
MILRKRKRNHINRLADAMFFWTSVLVSANACLTIVFQFAGILIKPWAGIAGVFVCTAISWTMFVLHRRYVLDHSKTHHVSAFLGLSLLLFFCLYNPLQVSQIWTLLLLYQIFLSFFFNRILLLIWGATSSVIYVFFHVLGQREMVDLLFSATLLAGSAIGSWVSLFTLQKLLNESGKSFEERKRENAISLLNTLVPIVERKTQRSSKEIEQMSRLMRRMVREFPLEQVYDWEIKLLSLLHYVSRIKWPDYVFESGEKLTAYEHRIIQEHCYIGREVFGDDQSFARVVQALQDHHERYDGKGYPNEHKGEEIPLLAQILGIIECYLAMTTPRPYRETATVEDAFQEIWMMAGRGFDERVVRAFAQAVQLHSPTKVSNAPTKVR